MLNIVLFINLKGKTLERYNAHVKFIKLHYKIMSQLLYLPTLYHDEPICTTDVYYDF